MEERAIRPVSSHRVFYKLVILSIGCSLILVGAGCGPVLVVSHQKSIPPAVEASKCTADDKSCELPGVPFYLVAYRCAHSTSWIRPIYLVTVTVTRAADDKTETAVSRVYDFKTFTAPDDPEKKANKVQKALLAIRSAGAVAKYETLLDDFKANESSDLGAFRQERLPSLPEGENTVLAANVVAPERYVSTDAVYFYNVQRPFNGSANAEINLNEEGILTKASGQVTDKTLDTILSTLGTLGAAALAIPAAAAGATAPAATAQAEGIRALDGGEAKYKFSIQIETKLYKYTHTAYVAKASPPCTPIRTEVGASEDFNSTFEDVTPGASAPQAADKAKADKPKK